MPKIKPISDLRNNFAEISKIVHEDNEPVFLTKNGHEDMVVMSHDLFEAISEELRIGNALVEAQLEAATNPTRYDFNQVSSSLRNRLIKKAEVANG